MFNFRWASLILLGTGVFEFCLVSSRHWIDKFSRFSAQVAYIYIYCITWFLLEIWHPVEKWLTYFYMALKFWHVRVINSFVFWFLLTGLQRRHLCWKSLNYPPLLSNKQYRPKICLIVAFSLDLSSHWTSVFGYIEVTLSSLELRS